MSGPEIPEIKVILLGETAVGKTSIIKRYYEGQFNENEDSSLTMSYVDKTIEIDEEKYKLIIWDTIGQETYRSISKLFLNESKIVILVYSIENKSSFTNLDFWYNLYLEELGKEVILGIAGNKADLYLNQQVPYEEGEKFAEERGAIFAEISAKQNKESIDHFMMELVRKYLHKGKKEKNEAKKNIKLDGKNNKPDKKGCCSGKKSE
jgi:small GTP-binding protein